MFLGDAPVAPIYQKGVAHLTNPQVKGLIYHKFGPNNSLKHVYIDKSIDKETGKKKNNMLCKLGWRHISSLLCWIETLGIKI